ncbi:uncharacterized protein LOC144174204 [Haemaphysalis longicornis]
MEGNLESNEQPARRRKRAADENSRPRQRSQRWGEAETFVLIDLWEGRLADLRRQKRNSVVYDEIAEGLRQAGFERSRDQVHAKIENLGNLFRIYQKTQTTGAPRVKWPFFTRVGKFLGNLPRNNRALVRESAVPSVEQIVIGMERGESSEVIEDDVAPSTSSDGLEAEPWYSDFDHVEYVPDDNGVIHVPAVTLLAPPQTAEPAREQTIEQQPPRQKRKSTSPPELVALLEEQKLMREDLKAARAKEYALRERQLVMQEKLYGAMTQYFNTHSAQK